MGACGDCLYFPRVLPDNYVMGLRRTVYSMLGVLMVALGAVGIVLPLLPTTPFLLLAAVLFAKSSRRRHDWLLAHKHLGPYIHAWRNKTGLTATQKLRIGISLSITFGVSIYFTPMVAIKCLLGGMWLFWTVMILRQKTIRPTIES